MLLKIWDTQNTRFQNEGHPAAGAVAAGNQDSNPLCTGNNAGHLIGEQLPELPAR